MREKGRGRLVGWGLIRASIVPIGLCSPHHSDWSLGSWKMGDEGSVCVFPCSLKH